MKKFTYEQQLKDTKSILKGLKEHRDDLIEKGYTTEKFIKQLEARLKETIEFKKIQQKKKAEMINATCKLNRNLDALRKARTILKDLVRTFVDKKQWKSFGMKYTQRKSISED